MEKIRINKYLSEVGFCSRRAADKLLEEGRITVNIRVDANGNVTSASVGSPTNISSTELRNAAISAAKATKFTSGNGVAAGTITYNFRLR